LEGEVTEDKTQTMLKSLKRRWLSARYLRSVTNGATGALLVISILASFLSAIIATGAFPSIPNFTAVAIAGLPGVCLTLWRQLPLREWAAFQNNRYIKYREISFSLEYGLIDLGTAVEKVNAVGRELAEAARAIPNIDLEGPKA
jgi:hypothetical protein